MWCVSHIVAALSFLKSTIRLEVPSFLGATPILDFQVEGLPTGTGSIMPNETFQPRSCLTFFQ